MKTKLFLRNIIWAVVIFVLCSIPGDNLPKTSGINIPHFDKVVHFGMFFVMGIFLCADLSIRQNLKKSHVFLISLALITIYGGIIEYLQQHYFVNRSGDYWDLFSDILGGIVAIMMYPWLKKQKDQLINRKPFNKISFLKKVL